MNELTQEKAKEIFHYEDGRLFWKIQPNRNKTAIKKGDRCGSKYQKRPYMKIIYKRKVLMEHRIIFLMHNGYLPKMIDHIDDTLTDEGIKSNKVENLQEITNSRNIIKAKINIRNKSGIKGVCWISRTSKWRAQICLDGDRINLGEFENKLDASDARKNAEIKYFKGYLPIERGSI